MNARNERGFSVIELMIVVVLIGIIATLAYPSYRGYMVRTAREAAESQLQQLANLQEKIFLNSTPASYTAVAGGTAVTNVTTAYNGNSSGGLGLATGQTGDGKYTITLPTLTATTFTLQADPVAGTMQEGDWVLNMDHLGNRTCTKGGTTKTWDDCR